MRAVVILLTLAGQLTLAIPSPTLPPLPSLVSSVPVLRFSTYLGGSGQDTIRDLATDAAGNIYAVGGTASPEFPVTLGPSFNTGSCSTLGSGGHMDAYVTKVSPAGQILWSRLLGGACYDRAYAVEVDPAGDVIVAGRAGPGFPTTSGTLQPSYGGDVAPNNLYGAQDGFLAKLSPAGAIRWATYVGGDDGSAIRDFAVDAVGDCYLMAQHVTRTFPHVTAGAFRTTRPGGEDVVVVKVTGAGQLVWGSYYGGTGYEGEGASIRVGASREPVVFMVTGSTNLPLVNPVQSVKSGGRDFAVARFTADGAALVFSTYFGGTGDEGVETHHTALDAHENAYVAGDVRAVVPTTPSAFQRTYGGGVDTAILKFSPTGALLASTLFGGSGRDSSEGVGIDAAGNFVFAGFTSSTSHTALASGGYQTTLSGGLDAILVTFAADLSAVRYLTYLGGSTDEQGRALALSGSTLVMGGQTTSKNFPTRHPWQATYGGGTLDAFLAVFSGAGP